MPDSDPQQLMAQLQSIQARLQTVDRRVGGLEQHFMEVQQALDTLEGLAGESGELQVLLPVGGGVQIPARVDASADVVMDVGAGYATPTGVADGVEALKSRLESAKQELAAANAEAQQLVQQGQALQQHLSAIEAE